MSFQLAAIVLRVQSTQIKSKNCKKARKGANSDYLPPPNCLPGWFPIGQHSTQSPCLFFSLNKKLMLDLARLSYHFLSAQDSNKTLKYLCQIMSRLPTGLRCCTRRTWLSQFSIFGLDEFFRSPLTSFLLAECRSLILAECCCLILILRKSLSLSRPAQIVAELLMCTLFAPQNKILRIPFVTLRNERSYIHFGSTPAWIEYSLCLDR